MKRVLHAYAWWAVGVVTAVGLAWAYHRRLVESDGDPDGGAEQPQQPPAAAT